MLTLLILQIRRNLKRNFELYKRIVIITLIVFFFVGNYHICNYYYPLDNEESVKNWWTMKMDIYSIIIVLCFYQSTLKRATDQRIRNIEKFISAVGVGLAISNAIDRHFNNVESFLMTDFITILAVFLVSFYDISKLKNKSEKYMNL